MTNLLTDIIPTASGTADGFKYAVSGTLIGSAFGGASVAAGDWLTKMANVNNSSEPIHVAARLLIRVSVATFGFLLADNIVRAVGPATKDPTGALFFNVSYIMGQGHLINSFLEVSDMVATQVNRFTGVECCSDCALGKPCAAEQE